ncbi:MAG: hypothetical protein ACEY3I_03135 [Arsenophonus sp.]
MMLSVGGNKENYLKNKELIFAKWINLWESYESGNCVGNYLDKNPVILKKYLNLDRCRKWIYFISDKI